MNASPVYQSLQRYSDFQGGSNKTKPRTTHTQKIIQKFSLRQQKSFWQALRENIQIDSTVCRNKHFMNLKGTLLKEKFQGYVP